MTEKNTAAERKIPEHMRPRRVSRVWVFASFLLSGFILFWAFTLPFRSEISQMIDAGDSSDAAAVVTEVKANQGGMLTAEQFRAAALELESEFMEARREKRRAVVVPSKAEVQKYWNQRLQKTHERLKQIGEPERDTLEWHERQQLLDSLEDAPR